MRIVVAAAVAATALAGAVPALAQSDSPIGLYGNLGGTLNDSQGATTKSITGRIGGKLNPYFGVEGELTAGIDGDNRTFAPGTAAERQVGVKQSFGGAAYAVGFLPVNPKFDLLARIGYGASRYKIQPDGLSDYRVNEHGLRYGAGAQYMVDGVNGVRFDYTRVDMNNFKDAPGYFSGSDKANVWSLSYVRKF
jgi:outer membrane immunogenic protein